MSQKSTSYFNIALWVVAVLLAALYGFAGFNKVTQTIPALSAMMGAWPTALPEWTVRTIGSLEIAGALGLILPAVTRILPKLTPIAAACFVLVQIGAMITHISLGEANVLPVNFVLLALAAFVAWGRWKKAPISAR